jgi:hypothetical protein
MNARAWNIRLTERTMKGGNMRIHPKSQSGPVIRIHAPAAVPEIRRQYPKSADETTNHTDSTGFPLRIVSPFAAFGKVRLALPPIRPIREIRGQSIRYLGSNLGVRVEPKRPSPGKSRRLRWGWLLLLGGWMGAGSLPVSADTVVAKFALNSSAEAVAIQFDVAPLAAGVSLTGPMLENAAPHGVDSNLLGSGATRFLVYSTTNAPLNPDGLVGVTLGVTSPSLLTDVMLRIENVIVSDAGGQDVDGQPDAQPVILSISPDAYRSVLVGAPLPLAVEVIDPDDAVTSVSFRIGGASQGVDDARPFAGAWTPLESGLHTFDVEVSSGGESATTGPVVVRAYAVPEISSFVEFAGIHFGPNGGNPALAGPAASPFGQGLPNLLAYFHGINPWSPDRSALPQLTRDASGHLIFRFLRSTSATDADYAILNSNTLLPASWLPLTGLPVTTTDLGNGLQELSITVPATGDRQFYRLQVTQTAPLQTWRQTWFGSSANSGDGADLNDFDNDGLPNLIEYATGLNPRQNSAGLLPRAQNVGGNLVVSFTQPSGVSGITYGAEWSQTLLSGSWAEVPDTGTAPQHTFSVLIGSNTNVFIRLRVKSP